MFVCCQCDVSVWPMGPSKNFQLTDLGCDEKSVWVCKARWWLIYPPSAPFTSCGTQKSNGNHDTNIAIPNMCIVLFLQTDLFCRAVYLKEHCVERCQTHTMA